MMDEPTDRTLLSAASSDPDAFAEFYRRRVGSLVSFAARRCASPEEVADLVASTFVIVIESAHTYDPDRGEPGAWLLGIAANIHAGTLRKRWRERLAAERLSGRRLLQPDDYARLEEMIDAARITPGVQAAIAKLPDTQREVVELVGHGLTPAEAASQLGIAPATARMRLTRARREIRATVPTDALPQQKEDER
jgi:RNA polymerase sigma-70 factor (ECF subfamily)